MNQSNKTKTDKKAEKLIMNESTTTKAPSSSSKTDKKTKKLIMKVKLETFLSLDSYIT